jgi:two-component system nitrogen regulation response regulator NtrX
MMNDDLRQVNKRVQELEELNRLSQVLSSTIGVTQTLEAIIQCSLILCQSERGAIVLFESGDVNEGHTIIRNSAPTIDSIDHRINVIVGGYILQTQQAFVAEDIITTAGYINPPERLRNLGAAMAVPLTSDGKVIGMINHVNSRDGRKFSPDEVRAAEIVASMASQFIVRAKVYESLEKNVEQLKESLAKEQSARRILGESASMRKVREDIALVAFSSANVLIMGETGTGKELTARALHQQSPRSLMPFVAVNCAAIPSELFESELFGHERGAFTGANSTMKGKFELADGGTLFLDEISEMPLGLQPKLLRVLEDMEFSRVGSSQMIRVDVRVLAASSRNLAEAAKTGEFREALFHRLNVVPIVLPPLRERKEDIPLLAQAMIRELSSGVKIFDSEALEVLKSRQWAGNVRELRNAVERITIFVRNRTVTANDIRTLGLNTDVVNSDRLVSALRELILSDQSNPNVSEVIEKELLRIALAESGGNVSLAARMIGIDRMTFQRRLEKFGIEKPMEGNSPAIR